MTPCFAEYIDEQIRASIDHCRRLIESGSDIDHAEYLDDPSDAVEVSQLFLKCRQNRQRREAWRLAPLIEGKIPSDLSTNDAVSIDGSVTSDVDQVAVNDAGQIVPFRRKRLWKDHSKFGQSLSDHGGSL